MLRVLVAEDDPIQRSVLVRWINELRPAWKVVATTETPEQTIAAMDEWAPDLSLIDIHLQGTASSEWVKTLPSGVPLIYVTGDPDFAVHAFDHAAIDYLLKPITMRRLKTALDRASDHPSVMRRESSAHASPGDRDARWLSVSRGNEILVVPPEDIIYLAADLKYTRVVSTRGEGLIRAGINELQQRLGDRRLTKIHRSIVVNLKFVESVKRAELGHLTVHLIGRSETLRVSRSFQDVFKSDTLE